MFCRVFHGVDKSLGMHNTSAVKIEEIAVYRHIFDAAQLGDIGIQAVHLILFPIEIPRFSDIQTAGKIVDVVTAKFSVDI